MALPAELPRTILDALVELVTAERPAQAEASVRAVFGEAATLYALDHAGDALNRLSGGEQIALRGRLRNDVLSGHVARVEGIVWVPLPDRDFPAFVVRLGDGSGVGDDDLHRISSAFGVALGTHRLRFEEVESQRRRSDMSIAAEMQWDLLPARADRVGAWDVAGALVPAYDVAGDVFDFACFDDELWAYSFDGMGHGMDATLTSVVALSAVRNARRNGATLDEQMNGASAAVFEQWGGDRFVTAVGCRVTTNGVSYVNAGHEPVRRFTGGTVATEELDAELPLGVEDGFRYRVQDRAPLGGGDGLGLFSDGAADARSPDGRTYGARVVDEQLAANWDESPLLVAHDVLDHIVRHIGDNVVMDDITAVVIRCAGDRHAG